MGEIVNNNTYYGGKLKYRCACTGALFDLFKAFDWIENSHKSDLFSPKRPIFLNVCAMLHELPSNISTPWGKSYLPSTKIYVFSRF